MGSPVTFLSMDYFAVNSTLRTLLDCQVYSMGENEKELVGYLSNMSFFMASCRSGTTVESKYALVGIALGLMCRFASKALFSAHAP